MKICRIISALAVSITFLLPLRVAAEEALVTPLWIAQHRASEGVKILQVKAGLKDDYVVPGAFLTDFFSDGWVVDYPGLPGMAPALDHLQKLIGGFGLDPNDHVVVVAADSDVVSISKATRILWTLALVGFDRLSLVDGGLAAYRQAGFETTRRPAKPIARFLKLTVNQAVVVRADQALMGVIDKTPPIDFRPAEYYQGEKGHPLVGLNRGTLHGAENIPAAYLLGDGQGRLKPKAELRRIFDGYLGRRVGSIVVFSDIGLRASLGWFVLSKVLKQPRVFLYDGSFIDWQGQGRDVWDQTDDMGGVIG